MKKEATSCRRRKPISVSSSNSKGKERGLWKSLIPLTSQIAVWKNFLPVLRELFPPHLSALKNGVEVLLGLLVLLLIAYRFRTHQVRRERKIRYRIGRMIAHLCDTYDSLEDVDWKKQKAYRYHFVDGDLKIDQRDIEGIKPGRPPPSQRRPEIQRRLYQSHRKGP